MWQCPSLKMEKFCSRFERELKEAKKKKGIGGIDLNKPTLVGMVTTSGERCQCPRQFWSKQSPFLAFFPRSELYFWAPYQSPGLGQTASLSLSLSCQTPSFWTGSYSLTD